MDLNIVVLIEIIFLPSSVGNFPSYCTKYPDVPCKSPVIQCVAVDLVTYCLYFLSAVNFTRIVTPFPFLFFGLLFFFSSYLSLPLFTFDNFLIIIFRF